MSTNTTKIFDFSESFNINRHSKSTAHTHKVPKSFLIIFKCEVITKHFKESGNSEETTKNHEHKGNT